MVLHTVEDLVRLSYEVLGPPTIRTFAINCWPQKMIEGKVRVEFGVLDGAAWPIAGGKTLVVFPRVFAMELRYLFVSPSVVHLGSNSLAS